MPHDNFNERRTHVYALMDRDGEISSATIRDLARQYDCGKTAIYRDIAAYSPIARAGYRDMEAANVQNNRARRLNISGSFTGQEFRELRKQYNDCCAICGEQRPLGPDHIRPLSKGGTNDITNIQPVCQPCNSRKGVRYDRHKG